MLCFFASDLHGKAGRYRVLLERIEAERPGALFLAGDLLPMIWDMAWAAESRGDDFLADYLLPAFRGTFAGLEHPRPRLLLILGNDDPRHYEETVLEAEREGLWDYLHGRSTNLAGHEVYGYACVPPTPFLLKDWERYDVSRYVDPGCLSPEEGQRSVPVDPAFIRHGSIEKDLAQMTGDDPMEKAILLFHSPPYQTPLDRAALDGQMVDHVPRDPHIGSIAIRRFIEARQPMLALHGHVHESTRLTGKWMDHIGATICLQAAHDGPELALIRFDLDDPSGAERELIPV